MQTVKDTAPRRYVSQLPSTPQMARYTAAPSSYTDPTVQASPPNPWGSSLGGCAGCGDLGGYPGEAIFDPMLRHKFKMAAGAAVGYGLAATKTPVPGLGRIKPLTGVLLGAVMGLGVGLFLDL